MNAAEIAARLQGRLAGRVLRDAPLGPFTTFRVGGPADLLVEAESEADLVAVAEAAGSAPVAVVGRGSNMLVSDAGFRGIAVRLGRSFRRHERTPDGLVFGGAVYLPAAARLCARLGLAGFEFAAEIPATFGGAVRMNAGAHDGCMADVLGEVTIVDLSTGRRRTTTAAGLEYGYRHSNITSSEIVTRGDVRLSPDEPSAVAARNAEHLRWRREHQPPGRSAGSVFKNPLGDSAGRLIDAAGAKGLRVGGAQVSPVHANFIVADPSATAADVWELIRRVREAVATSSGIELEPEVRFLGSFA